MNLTMLSKMSDTKGAILHDSPYIKVQKMVLEVQDSGYLGEVVTTPWEGNVGELLPAGTFCFLICVYVGGACFLSENLTGCKLDLCTFL